MKIIKRPGESYQHAAARTVLLSWLKEKDGHFGPFSWHGSMWEEYPFIEGYLASCLSEIRPNIKMTNPPIPTYEELAANNIYPIVIADICLIHKGSPFIVIEIVHKNELSEEKINKFKNMQCGFGLQIWRVEAHWILGQVGMPTNFPDYGIRRVGWKKPTKEEFYEMTKNHTIRFFTYEEIYG